MKQQKQASRLSMYEPSTLPRWLGPALILALLVLIAIIWWAPGLGAQPRPPTTFGWELWDAGCRSAGHIPRPGSGWVRSGVFRPEQRLDFLAMETRGDFSSWVARYGEPTPLVPGYSGVVGEAYSPGPVIRWMAERGILGYLPTRQDRADANHVMCGGDRAWYRHVVRRQPPPPSPPPVPPPPAPVPEPPPPVSTPCPPRAELCAPACGALAQSVTRALELGERRIILPDGTGAVDPEGRYLFVPRWLEQRLRRLAPDCEVSYCPGVPSTGRVEIQMTCDRAECPEEGS